MNVTRCHPNET